MERGKHHVARERRLHRNLRRLHVADLAHEDPIGILPQDRPQAGREGVADLRVDRHLHDAFDVVFHGVFRGDQLLLDAIELGEGRIERGRLARTRGPRHQDDAVGPVDHLTEPPQHVGRHAELLEIERDHATVEHPHHHALAEKRRQHAHAEVDRMAAHRQLDPAVLRKTPLGDVEIRHHLDPSGDRKGEMLRRRHHLLQHAVGLQPDPELMLERLEVDVAGAVADRHQEHHVEELADRRALGQRLNAREVDRAVPVGRRSRCSLQVLVAGQFVDDRFDRVGRGRIILLDRLLNLGFRRHADLDVVAEQHPQLVGDLNLLRLRRRDREPVALQRERHDAVELRHRLADDLQHVALERRVSQLGDGRSPLLGERLRQLLLRDHRHRDADAAQQLAAARSLFGQHRFELLLVDDAEVDQDLSEPSECHGLVVQNQWSSLNGPGLACPSSSPLRAPRRCPARR